MMLLVSCILYLHLSLNIFLSIFFSSCAAVLRYIGSHLSSVLVTVSLSVIIISICIVLLQRQRIRSPPRSPSPCLAAHLPHKTLPRALQQQQYQCTL